MSAKTLPSPRSHRSALLLGAALCAVLASNRAAWAADDVVRLACPDLTTERAAELESRIRANLLTAELPATVQLSCGAERTEVRVDATPDSVTVQVQTGSIDTFRDDVLRGVEEALQELARRRSRRAGVPDATNAPDAGTVPAVAEPEPAPAAPMPAPRPRATAAPRTQPPVATARPWTELFGAGLGEVWADRLALGGALGVGRSTPTIWYGLRAAVLRPAVGSTDFDATEYHASVELGIQPRLLAGFRASIGLGPSVLFVTPRSSLTAHNNNAKASLFVAARVSRPVWFGQFALVPELGARLFSGKRGVRIDTEERLALRGLAPFFSLGAAYRF